MNLLFFFFAFSFLTACRLHEGRPPFKTAEQTPPSYQTIADIATPDGYTRIPVDSSSFGQWLRNISLKKDNRVFLYNGLLKENQSAHYAVLDMTIGAKDLQQCADAVMRLRAEYLFSQRRYSAIEFRDNAGRAYTWKGSNDRPGFEKYLETVFSWCGSASLEKQLYETTGMHAIAPGDVLIRGGFPGHAMIIVDVAINPGGEKIFMLAQSYMPAQDIHIVINPLDDHLSPWYSLGDSVSIVTPEWVFSGNQLCSWHR